MPFDNFDPIMSYEIENCKREATVLPPQCSAIGNTVLSSNVTQYTTNVSTNALYQFEITALNSIGESVGSFVTVLEREFSECSLLPKSLNLYPAYIYKLL